MKKLLILHFILALVLSGSFCLQGQETLKLRISGNNAKFMGEPQGKEINGPSVDTLLKYSGPFPDFTHKGGLGIEAELMKPLSEKITVGLEISNDLLTGENDNPGQFNFQYKNDPYLLQLQHTVPGIDTIFVDITSFPLKYRTNLINLMGTFRIYPLAESAFRPFFKISAGISLVSTELALKSPSLWMQDTSYIYGPPVLYSKGTPDGEKGRFPAFTFGGGIGVEYQLTEKLALYVDGTVRMVYCDILDGKPNLDYNADTKLYDRFNTWANTGKLSFGVVYTLKGRNTAYGGGGGGGRGGGKGKSAGRTHPHLPFYEQKPR